MAGTHSVTALVVGSITRDRELSGGEIQERPGGVVYYAGLALTRLGARTRVVTRVRSDDAAELLGPLHAEGIETAPLPSVHTTTYLNDYSGERDRHQLEAISDPISSSDIPPAWRAADLIHLGPLHRRDLLPDVPAALRGFKGIDLQGLVRKRGPGGTRLAPFPALARFLEGVDVVQASEEELDVVLEGDTLERFARRYAIRELIVTRGARGAWLLSAGRRTEVTARFARRAHPVGAGDVFLASYLFLRVGGFDPGDAAGGAAQVCAEKLERGEVPKGFKPVPAS